MKKTAARKIYFSLSHGTDSVAARYADLLRSAGIIVYDDGKTDSLNSCDFLLLILSPESDLRLAKGDLNYALDRGKHVLCVTVGTPPPDQGLAIQLGLAKKVQDSDQGPQQILEYISSAAKPQKRRYLLFAAIAAVVIIAAGIVLRGHHSAAPDMEPPAPEPVSREIPNMEPALHRALLANGLDTDGDGAVSKAELSNVETLELSGCGICDITPLAYAEKVTRMDLSDNQITDVTPLLALKELQTLDISRNPVEDVSVLAFLPDLQELIGDE